jgi:hypothetical protein
VDVVARGLREAEIVPLAERGVARRPVDVVLSMTRNFEADQCLWEESGCAQARIDARSRSLVTLAISPGGGITAARASLKAG